MTIVVCLDDELGMLFNHRRQSRDRIVLERLTALAHEQKLWMSEYSAAMFEDASAFYVDNRYDERMADDDACFVEDGALTPDRANKLILLRWNRRYPADRRFPADILANEWQLISTHDTVGSSHDCITEEHYRKKE